MEKSKLSDPRTTSAALATGRWYHLDQFDIEGDRAKILDLVQDETLARSLSEWHPRPALFAQDGKLVVILKAPNLTPDGDVEDMIALRLFTDGRDVFSFSILPMKAVTECRRAAEQTPVSAFKLLTRLAQSITSKLRLSVAEMLDELDRLEDAVIDPSTTVPVQDLLIFRRRVIGFKRSSAPQTALLTDLSELEDMNVPDDCRDAFRQTANSNLRIDEILDAMRQRSEAVTQLIEAESRRSAERITYLLTIAAGVFLPLNLIAGMFGANVADVPLADTPGGFTYMIAILVVIAAGSLSISVGLLTLLNRRKK